MKRLTILGMVVCAGLLFAAPSVMGGDKDGKVINDEANPAPLHTLDAALSDIPETIIISLDTYYDEEGRVEDRDTYQVPQGKILRITHIDSRVSFGATSDEAVIAARLKWSGETQEGYTSNYCRLVPFHGPFVSAGGRVHTHVFSMEWTAEIDEGWELMIEKSYRDSQPVIVELEVQGVLIDK